MADPNDEDDEKAIKGADDQSRKWRKRGLTEKEKEKVVGDEEATKRSRAVAQDVSDLTSATEKREGKHDTAEVRRQMGEAADEGQEEGQSRQRNRRLMRQLYDNPRGAK